MDIIEKLVNQQKEGNYDIVMSCTRAFLPNQNFADSSLVDRLHKTQQYFDRIKKLINLHQISEDNFQDSLNIPWHSWGKLYRRDFLISNDLWHINQNIINEDVGFALKKLSLFPKISILNEVGTHYRIRKLSITDLDKDRQISEKFEKIVLNDAFLYINQHADKDKAHKIIHLVKTSPRYISFYIKDLTLYQKLSFFIKKIINSIYKCKTNENIRIVSLRGGLGNQMFQYAFGKALEHKTGEKVLFDNSWFQESKKLIVNGKNENSIGVVMRNYKLNLFELDVPFANQQEISSCKNKTFEKNDFIYDKSLFTKQSATYYEGYFQNENYFKEIKSQIKEMFKFPLISKLDKFNHKWLNKIKKCKNPVFIHIRRGDYLNLQGWVLPTNYYKKAIKYIMNNVKDPSFFIFGQDCADYVRKEFNFNINATFEFVGEINSDNHEDWKDLVLMQACKHAIISNSTFSWWAAWLGRPNTEGIVIAPSPFLQGKDEIICNNWIKIYF